MDLRGHKHSVPIRRVFHKAGPQERVINLTLSGKCKQGARGLDKDTKEGRNLMGKNKLGERLLPSF